MKRLFYITFMLCAAASFGCEKEGGAKGEPAGLVYAPGPRCFAPRAVDYVWVRPYAFTPTSIDDAAPELATFGVRIETNNRLFDGATYPDCDVDTWMQIDKPIPEIEELFRAGSSAYHYIWFVPVDEMIKHMEEYLAKTGNIVEGRLYPLLVEYRTEGIADLRITADRPLFGEPAGSLLNKYFKTRAKVGDRSHQIPYIASENFNEIDFSEDELIDGDISGSVMLNDWLARKPLAMPHFWIYTSETIDSEIAGKVMIDVEMTTTAGKRFKASHKIDVLGRDSDFISVYHSVYRKEDLKIYMEEYLATRLDR